MLKQYRFMRSPGLCRTLALAAALIGGAAAPPAFAQTQYTFATPSGAPYCDGLLLTQQGRVYRGLHNSPTNSCTEGDQAGGFWARGYGASAGTPPFFTVTPTTRLVTITTEDSYGGPGFEIVFNLDLVHMLWNVWVEDTATSTAFTQVNSGVLLSPLAAKAADRLAQERRGTARDRPALNRPAIFR
jgi:hypothetical protein